MDTIASIMEAKGNKIYTVKSSTSVLEALQLMFDKGIGALPVMDEETLVGIFTERDFARLAVREKKVDLATAVESCMTKEVYGIKPDEDIEEVMALMIARHIRHVPVVEANKMVGILSIGDVVENLVEDKDLLVKDMRDYLLGGSAQ